MRYFTRQEWIIFFSAMILAFMILTLFGCSTQSQYVKLDDGDTILIKQDKPFKCIK